jgi:P4 family phage/plasmid primase-like protien
MQSCDFLIAATRYIEQGWPVFPCRERDKRPAVSGGFKAASLEPAMLAEWAGRNAHYNVGLPTGAASGVVILEFDFGKGGEDSLAKFREIYGEEFLDTYTVRSGSGGLHLYYRVPDWSFTNKAGLAGFKGVDTRGEGGYVVAPPSIHPNGNPYTVEKEINPAKCPEWLRSLMDGPFVTTKADAAPAVASGTKGKLSKRTIDFLLGNIPENTFNSRLFLAAKDFQEQGYSKEEATRRFEAINGYLDDKDLPTIDSAFNKTPKHPPRPQLEIEDIEESSDIAKEFIANSGRLLEWQKHFYLYNGRHYVRHTQDDIKSRLINYILKRGGVPAGKLRGIVDEAMLYLLAHTHLDSNIRPPTWLDERPEGLEDFLTVRNGILPLSAVLRGDQSEPLPHSDSYFSTASLPYASQPGATSEAWQSVLSDVQPDPEVRALIQEWFGYNLIQDTSMEKFVLLQGNGGDGKSVLCLVLRELLGRENCSAVSLEGFDARRPFQLASTMGKLANIVEDVNHIEKAQEGLLKDFVSGGTVQVEEKYGAPYPMEASARVTFSCNNLPRFTDRSGGLWRRLILIPFPKSIPLDKQDRRLKLRTFWEPELPGIFNWAVEGLLRLRANGNFTIPKAVKDATDGYALEMNPARQFVLDCYEADPTAEPILLQDVFNKYRAWCAAASQPHLTNRNFNKELLKAFSGQITQGKRALGGSSARVWLGLKERQDSEILEDVKESTSGKLLEMDKRTGRKGL